MRTERGADRQEQSRLEPDVLLVYGELSSYDVCQKVVIVASYCWTGTTLLHGSIQESLIHAWFSGIIHM